MYTLNTNPGAASVDFSYGVKHARMGPDVRRTNAGAPLLADETCSIKTLSELIQFLNMLIRSFII